jgi:hypothetical protein
MARPKSAHSAIRNLENMAKWHYISRIRLSTARDQMAIRACARRRLSELHPASLCYSCCFNLTFAVRTRVTSRPPHRSVRAAFPHTAPTSGINGEKRAVCEPTPVTRWSGTESSTCFTGPHSPRSLPFAPPTPPRIAPFCSSASQLL